MRGQPWRRGQRQRKQEKARERKRHGLHRCGHVRGHEQEESADVIAGCLATKPDCVLGLANGLTTPIGLYADLVQDCAEGRISFADATHLRLRRSTAASTRGVTRLPPASSRQNLFDHVDVDVARTHVHGRREPGRRGRLRGVRRGHRPGGRHRPAAARPWTQRPHRLQPALRPFFPVDTHVVEARPRAPSRRSSRLFDSVDEVPREAYYHGHRHLHHAGPHHPGGGKRRRQGARSCTATPSSAP